jgi:Family of unknown function (DUF6589)
MSRSINPECLMPTAPRTSRAGRRIHHHYDNAISLDSITDDSQPQEVAELEHDSMGRHCEEISDIMIAKGVTMNDLVAYQLVHAQDRRTTRRARKLMSSEDVIAVVKTCCEQHAGSDQVNSLICELATSVFQKEYNNLITSSILKQKIKECSHNALTSFDFADIWTRIQQTAPQFSKSLHDLVTSARSDLNDSDHSTDIERELDDVREAEEDTDNEDDPAAAVSTISQQERIKRREKRRLRRQTVILTTIVSSLCYAGRKTCNVVALELGYYLVSANVPKRAIELLHQVGISVCYKSVTKAMKAVANSTLQELATLPSTFPRFWNCLDNMDFTVRVAQQVMNRQGGLLHYTIGFAGANPVTGRMPMFTAADIQLSRITNLTADDLLPDLKDEHRSKELFHVGTYASLLVYCRESLTYTKSSGKSLLPIIIRPIHQLLPLKTHLWSFPAYAKNEAKIEECCELAYELQDTTGLDRERYGKNKIMLVGDYLTARNIRYLLS